MRTCAIRVGCLNEGKLLKLRTYVAESRLRDNTVMTTVLFSTCHTFISRHRRVGNWTSGGLGAGCVSHIQFVRVHSLSKFNAYRRYLRAILDLSSDLKCLLDVYCSFEAFFPHFLAFGLVFHSFE
jgi:hypothetical protein